MRHAAWLSMVLVLGASSVALAEGPDGAPPPPPPPAGPPPGPPVQGEQQAYVQPGTEQPGTTGTQGRGIEYGGHLVVPVIWLGSGDNKLGDDLDPGFGIQGRIGWEFCGGVTAELNIGVLANTFTDFPEASLTDVWFGAALRYHFFNPSAIVPFVGAGLQLNVWELCITDTTIGTVCTSDDKDSSRVTFGFNGSAGLAYELSEFLAIEAGLTVNYTLAGDVFVDGSGTGHPQIYLTPFFGGTLYY